MSQNTDENKISGENLASVSGNDTDDEGGGYLLLSDGDFLGEDAPPPPPFGGNGVSLKGG